MNKYSAIWAVKQLKVDYPCKGHKEERIHKYGTKVWENHLDKIDIKKLQNNVTELAEKLEKEHEESVKKIEVKFNERIKGIVDAELSKRKDAPIFFLFRIYGFTDGADFRLLGKMEGYESYEKLKADNKYELNSADINTIYIIYKAEPFKIYRKSKTGFYKINK